MTSKPGVYQHSFAALQALRALEPHYAALSSLLNNDFRENMTNGPQATTKYSTRESFPEGSLASNGEDEGSRWSVTGLVRNGHEHYLQRLFQGMEVA